MTRKLLFVVSAILLSAAIAQAGPVYPTLALPTSYTGLRMMKVKKDPAIPTPGSSEITVVIKGDVDGSFSLASTGTDALTVDPLAGTVKKQSPTPVPFSFGWTDLSTTGPQTGEITLTNVSYPSDPNNHVMSVSGAVLEQRKLNADKLQLNVLKCATSVSGNFVVHTTNRNPDYATYVTVAPGGAVVGDLVVAETLVNTSSPVNVAVLGTPNTSAYGFQRAVRGDLPVVTAEDPSVGDTKAYRDLSVQYEVNVGVAELGPTPGSFTGAMVLSANVATGKKLTGLSSKVNPSGTLAVNKTLMSKIIAGRAILSDAALYGAVGSEAVIVTSTPVVPSSGAVVTMQWRQRTPGEAGVPGAPTPTQPPGYDWFASDVVNIGGVADNVTYALQMSFDDRILLMKDGLIAGQVVNNWQAMFIGELDGGMWGNAGDQDNGHYRSLSDFLYVDNPGTSLKDLVGSWGVDPSVNKYGRGHSWTIVEGGGVFVVVPEPSTLVLLILAGASLIAYSLRRRWL